MPIYVRKRIHLFGPFYLNLGKKSVSLSTKIGPVSRTISTSGRRTTSANLPGPLGYRKVTTKQGRHRGAADGQPRHRGMTEEEREYEQTLAALQARKDAALARRAARRRRRQG